MQIIPTYECQDSDYAKFYEPIPESKKKVQSLREQGGLVCIDWSTAGLELYGTWATGDTYAALEIAAVPCHRRQILEDGSFSEIRDDCVTDETAVWEYLGEYNLMLYMNQGTRVQTGYDEQSIDYNSAIFMTTPITGRPSYSQTWVEVHQQVDETELV